MLYNRCGKSKIGKWNLFFKQSLNTLLMGIKWDWAMESIHPIKCCWQLTGIKSGKVALLADTTIDGNKIRQGDGTYSSIRFTRLMVTKSDKGWHYSSNKVLYTPSKGGLSVNRIAILLHLAFIKPSYINQYVHFNQTKRQFECFLNSANGQNMLKLLVTHTLI
jgi:hypothetical protein